MKDNKCYMSVRTNHVLYSPYILLFFMSAYSTIHAIIHFDSRITNDISHKFMMHYIDVVYRNVKNC